MALILADEKIEIPGLETISWLDSGAVPRATDGAPRTGRIRAIVLHTVHGKRGGVLPGRKTSKRAETYAVYQAQTARQVSWDYTVDTDGTVIVSNDPLRRYTWHAGAVNGFTLGIEMVQEANGDLYADQIAAVVQLIDFLTALLSDRGHPIQRQIPWKNGKAVAGVLARLANSDTDQNVTGVYGHRNQTTNRGPGDPGDSIFEALHAAGYLGFDYDSGEDIAWWKAQQRRLGLQEDGIPGPAMAAALKAEGHAHGLWVERPGD